MDRERGVWGTTATAVIASLVLLSTLMSLTPDVNAKSFRQPLYVPTQKMTNRNDIIARAKTWVVAHVAYSESQTDLYQGYRKDCSAFVSMAWGLPGPGLTTYTLPTVSQQINKDELQPGDVLNNQDGGGNPNFAHVVIFDSWVDSSHTHYNAYEEDPYWNGAHYTQNIPYPYWPGYYNSQLDYTPMRLNGLSNSTPPMPPTPQPRLTTVTVSATQGWQDSGVVVNAGDHVTILYVSGLWTSTAGSIAPFDGTGRPDGYTCANYLPASQCVEPVPDAPQGALVGMIGAQLLKVGDSLSFTATQGGSLFLRMNDGDNGLYDNQGSITVQIEVS